MAGDAVLQANTLLERFYATNGEDRTADRELTALVECVRPLIRQRLRTKGAEGEDIEELCGETITRIIEAIRSSHAPDGRRIAICYHYVLTSADHVFADYLRRLRPNWYRLRRRILYLLDVRGSKDSEVPSAAHPEGTETTKGSPFARWYLRYDCFGGFARWHGQSFQQTNTYRAFCANRNLLSSQRLQHRDPAHLPLPELLAHLFQWLGTPLEVDELTTHVAALQQVSDAPSLSLDALAEAGEREMGDILPEATSDVAEVVLSDIAAANLQTRLWSIVQELLPYQRTALLLALSREELLLLGGSVSQITDMLEIPLESFLPLWRTLPLADKDIAERLDIMTKQVSNLRKCAREKIGRWLAKAAK